ncbi:MAG: hypothetical protein ACE5NN_06535 [Candidatus Bathyarchaeia archaeon]
MIPIWVIALIGGITAAGVTAATGTPSPPGLAVAIKNIAVHASQNIGTQNALNILNTLVNGGIGAGVSGGIAAVAKSLARAFAKTK